MHIVCKRTGRLCPAENCLLGRTICDGPALEQAADALQAIRDSLNEPRVGVPYLIKKGLGCDDGFMPGMRITLARHPKGVFVRELHLISTMGSRGAWVLMPYVIADAFVEEQEKVYLDSPALANRNLMPSLYSSPGVELHKPFFSMLTFSRCIAVDADEQQNILYVRVLRTALPSSQNQIEEWNYRHTTLLFLTGECEYF